jgi:outer membrane protein OmpA-like peptidoglycan-associated protein
MRTETEAQPDMLRAETMGLGADEFADTLKRNMTQHVGGDDDFPIPDTSHLTMEEKRKVMDDILDKVLETNIAFEPNKAEIQKRGMKKVRQITHVLGAFPAFTIKCVGHSKGRPADNNIAKRELSQARAEAVKEALIAEGVQNELVCASWGSALGRGMCVRINAFSPEEVQDGVIHIPDCSDMSRDQQEASLNQLLYEALEKGLAFEPNKASIQAAGASVVNQVGAILKAFPDFTIRCEGHAKGQAMDNSDAKRRLSQVRAEAVRAALVALGVANTIVCVGMGSSQGLGMCVRMFATDPDKEVDIPDATGMSAEAKEKLLNSLLEKALERNIEFEPNKSEIPPAGQATIRELSRIIAAFPEFAIVCEGHTKGQPSENSDAKRKLSHARAESVRSAIAASVVANQIVCRGAGSSQGLGLCVKMFVIDPEELKKDEITVPSTDGLTTEQQAALLDELLERALLKNIEFEPNVYEIPPTGGDTIKTVANLLRQFPEFAIRCEGHAKGAPADNSEAKKKLSYMRAESVKARVKQQGVENGIRCVGEGCAQGRGMCVRMYVIDQAELTKDDVVIPEETGKSREERAKTLNELLATALENNINFEPNRADIPHAGMEVITQLSRVLKAFPEFSVRCEGHAKGKPADNNEAKMKLSQVRAQAVSNALKKDGVVNEIVCVGRGSEQGLGMCVRMFTDEAGYS